MEIILAVGIIVTIVLFLIALRLGDSLIAALNTTNTRVGEYIISFQTVKDTVNHNADNQRAALLVIDKHDKQIVTLTVLYDIISEKLNLDENLRARLEESPLLDIPVSNVVDSD